MSNLGIVKGYWFPLVLLGFGLLGLLGWASLRTPEAFGWFAYAPIGRHFLSANTISIGYMDERVPLRGAGWAGLVFIVLVGTTAWYGWRARQAGDAVRTYVMVAIAGTVAVAACDLAAGIADSADDTGAATSVGLPLVGLGVLAGAWAFFRPGARRRLAAGLGIGCLAVGLGTVLGAWAPGLIDPILITGGLLVLARFERSRILAVVAGAALLAMVAVPTGPLSMLLPATLLLLAGVAVLAVRQVPTAG